MMSRQDYIKQLEEHYCGDGFYFVGDSFSPDILAVRVRDDFIGNRKGWLTQVYKLNHDWFEDNSWGNIFLLIGMPNKALREYQGKPYGA